MKIRLGIEAKNSQQRKELLKELKKYDITPSKNPNIIISLGGDGTFLVAEKKHPGIPKLLIRDSEVCKKCTNSGLDKVVQRLKKDKFRVVTHHKIQGLVQKKEVLATNDVVIRNKLPTMAARFQLFVNGKSIPPMIGDGVVISTVFGSTGYYHSVSQSTFKKGWGVAFNNITKKKKALLLKPKDLLEVRIIRGPVTLSSDNHKKIFTLASGEKATFTLSSQTAKVLDIDNIANKLFKG